MLGLLVESSGGAYTGEKAADTVFRVSWLSDTATPQSAIWTSVPATIIMLSGLMSQWTIGPSLAGSTPSCRAAFR